MCSRPPTGIAGFRPSITGKAWGNRRSYRRGFGRQFYFRDLTAGARLNTGIPRRLSSRTTSTVTILEFIQDTRSFFLRLNQLQE